MISGDCKEKTYSRVAGDAPNMTRKTISVTGPTARFPLVLIPAFFVPLFVMLHLAALFQAQRLARSENRLTRCSRAGAMAAGRVV